MLESKLQIEIWTWTLGSLLLEILLAFLQKEKQVKITILESSENYYTTKNSDKLADITFHNLVIA
jgi:hypothetical protein